MSENVEVSVILPCLNEENGVGICIEKIKRVFEKENINGEIIVVDNGSTDNSYAIAKNKGAKVIKESLEGYGAAYIRGLKESKGKYIIMGDSDGSYDFYKIPDFIQFLDKGYDFVIGNRFKGKIHKKAMPWANRYLGNPVLSGLYRLFFRTNLSDIHCGMRGFTRNAYEKMNVKCAGMEFAAEMVMEALYNNLKIREIAIEYYPRAGKSKLRPFQDAWRHIKFMFLFCPMWLYFIPGVAITLLGLFLLLILAKGPVLFLGHLWDIHVMVLAALMSMLGWQIFNMGVYAKTFAVRQGYLKSDKLAYIFTKYFKLEIGISIGLVFFIVGLGINLVIFIEWLQKSFGSLYRIREVILAMTFMVIGLQTIFSSFFISLLLIKK
ncbi:MAG: glycosyltransferase family 2 protein [bacterium]|nr:glycosyltransferase family 2 protein [bacterium]